MTARFDPRARQIWTSQVIGHTRYYYLIVACYSFRLTFGKLSGIDLTVILGQRVGAGTLFSENKSTILASAQPN